MAGTTNIVGEVHLLVRPLDPNGQFNTGVNSIIKKLEAQAQFQIKASGLEQVQQGANGIGQAFGQAAVQAAGLTAAIYGIKRGVEGAINKFAGLFDQLAQAKAGFTSILKSEAAGGQLLDDIREFARVSPFVTQELVNYSQQLLGVGLAAKEIIPLLKSTGDIISSVGGDTQNLGRVLFTLTQIKSIGVLKGQDTMQLQNSLIPITKYLSEYLHKSAQEIVKLREAGLITADTVFNALNQQGDKVKGAMDKATRNIAGAKAILSDTVIQLFQNQPVLDKIFKDIFTSIKALADRLGQDDFQQAFAQFFDGVEKLYDGVKPLVAALADLADSSLISGLQIFGSTIGFLGSVLKALPVGVMELFARILFSLSILKAPLLLIAYVRSIATMAAAILPATQGLARFGRQAELTAVQVSEETTALQANTVAREANAAATTSASKGKLGLLGGGGKAAAGILAGSVVAEVAGSWLSQKESTGAKTAGGALQGAGFGAQIGMIGGPEGAAAGAAIGAAIGAVTSYMAASEAKAKAHVEEMRKIGDDAANAFIEQEGRMFGTAASGLDFESRKARIKELEDIIAAKKAELSKTGTTQYVDPNTGADTATEENPFGTDKVLVGAPRKAAEDALTSAQGELDKLAPSTAAVYDIIKKNIAGAVEGLDKEGASYLALTKVVKGYHSEAKKGEKGFGGTNDIRVATDNITVAQDVLAKYGFTLEDLAIPERLEEFLKMAQVFDGLSTAEQKATSEAIKWNTALKSAKETVATIYDPLQVGIAEKLNTISLDKAVGNAAVGLSDNTDPAKTLQYQEAILKKAADARSRQKAADDLHLTALTQQLAVERQGKPETQTKADAETIRLEKEAAATRQDAAAKDVLTEANDRLTASRRVAAQYDFLTQYNTMKATGDLLGQLYEVTDKNVVQLSGDTEALGNVVRSFAAQAQASTQAAIAAGDKNAEADGATRFALALELVQVQLKLSDEAFKAYLDSIGVIEPAFQGISGSFAEVAKKLGLPQEELAKIVGLVGQIPTGLNMVVTVEAAAAIATLESLNNLARGTFAYIGFINSAQYKDADKLINGSGSGLTFAAPTIPKAGAGAASGADKVASATEALIAKLEAAAQAIADAAERWVGSIKERTQYESAVSAGTATRNARRQIKDLTEITAGLAVLRARGLSDEAIKALGIDNVNDVKQVRKLVKASDSDLGALSQSVAGLGEKATILATSEEDSRTRKNIAEGILAAAKTLEIGVTKPEAAALAAQFTITTTSDAEAIAKAILEALTSGNFGR